MPEVVQNVASFRADRAWGARELLELDGTTTVRLHWTDAPYQWHVNDGSEAFIVLSGIVDMHYDQQGVRTVVRLGPSDVFLAHAGDAHRAEPVGEARILVIERKGSV